LTLANKTLHYEWYLGHQVASVPEDSELFYAFVDLRLRYWEPDFKPKDIAPEIFIMPLAKVADWYRQYVKPGGMSRLWATPDFLEGHKDAFGLLLKAISG
jgi:hypothetical protein